jgi:hypothetical protein
MTHSAWWLVVNIVAVYRLSILLSKDKICAPVRDRVWLFAYEWVGYLGQPPEPGKRHKQRRPGWLGRVGKALHELVICPWCLSVWFAGGAIALTVLIPAVWQWPATILAVSGVTVLWTWRTE